jgi:hypothetical protein
VYGTNNRTHSPEASIQFFKPYAPRLAIRLLSEGLSGGPMQERATDSNSFSNSTRFAVNALGTHGSHKP